MRILGIDPGLKATGYGLIEYKRRQPVLMDAGAITPKARDAIQFRIQTVYDGLSRLIDTHGPDVLVLEKLYAHHAHPATSGIMGHVRGAICLLCAQKNIELAEHSVKRIRKAVTGNGNAGKDQTRRVISGLFSIKPDKLTLDTSDALALAVGYAYMHGQKI